ncbi:MAG: hypothetical protein Harvfovirus74_7, partial [Harvfovirus sp.]
SFLNSLMYIVLGSKEGSDGILLDEGAQKIYSGSCL